jgi:hypothetical protein
VLVDLDQARTTTAEDAATLALAAVRALVARLVPGERAPAEAGDLVGLIQALDRRALGGEIPRLN